MIWLGEVISRKSLVCKELRRGPPPLPQVLSGQRFTSIPIHDNDSIVHTHHHRIRIPYSTLIQYQ